MIEVNYCLEAMDFADMAALRRRLTRITPILFFAAVGFGCAVAGFSARSHRPAVALAACLPLLAMGVLLLCRGPVSRRMYTRLCKAHPSLTAPVQMRITGTEVEWTMPGEKPDQCEIHAVYPMAMFGAVFETGRLFAFAIPGTVTLLLPKRALPESDLPRLRDLLHNTAYYKLTKDNLPGCGPYGGDDCQWRTMRSGMTIKRS